MQDMHRDLPHPTEIPALQVSRDLKALLERPLIVGASVSANHRGIASPGRQLALRATSAQSIRTLAKNGKSAREVLKDFKPEDLADRTIVIALDLLFWDSTLPMPSESVKVFRNFVKAVETKNLILVLGEVPGFFPAMQPNWRIMNEEIHETEKRYSRTLVLPFDSIYHQILNEGSFQRRGIHYTIHELVPDGLHLSTLAGKVLADLLQDELMKRLTS